MHRDADGLIGLTQPAGRQAVTLGAEQQCDLLGGPLGVRWPAMAALMGAAAGSGVSASSRNPAARSPARPSNQPVMRA